jgi:hypothetical protein
MNYLELINRFWRMNAEKPFSTLDTKLYFYLLHTCNSLYWKMPFGHSDAHLAKMMDITVSTARAAKKRLSERSLIVHKATGKAGRSYNSQTQYWIRFEGDERAYNDLDTTRDNVRDTTDNNKLNKTKPHLYKIWVGNNLYNESTSSWLCTHKSGFVDSFFIQHHRVDRAAFFATVDNETNEYKFKDGNHALNYLRSAIERFDKPKPSPGYKSTPEFVYTRPKNIIKYDGDPEEYYKHAMEGLRKLNGWK